jgi:twitching motility protein PilT
MTIEQIFKEMVDRGASDVHLRVGVPPALRINGDLYRLQSDRVSPEMMEGFLTVIMNRNQRARFDSDMELDFAVGVRGLGRFRINGFRQRGTPALAIRHITQTIPAFDTLGLPEVVRDLALKERGLILVTGTTGSGKSTTMASMIDHINEMTSSNIITVEDPIEFLYRDKRSIISQREVGYDTHDFPRALKASFREDPDAILIGEIRDHETMHIALQAADTGHLVMSTLHTMNATETISRIVSFYPPHQHQQVRLLLANTLVAIISLRLLPRKDRQGRIPAAEVLVNNATIKEYLVDQMQTHLIEGAIREGNSQYGSQSFDQSVHKLFVDGMISYEVALRNASNPADFELKLRGVEGTSDRSWMT